MGGSNSTPSRPPVVSNANINIDIRSKGEAATTRALEIANNPEWNKQLNQARETANNSGHDCGPGNRGSKDSDTVYNLERYVNNNNNQGITNLLEKHANDFYDKVNWKDGECWKYWNGLAAETEKIKGPKTDALNNDNTSKITQYTNTIGELENLKLDRQGTLADKKIVLGEKQAELVTTKAELVTEQGYLGKITNVKSNATHNEQLLINYKDSLTENIKTNHQFNNYLNERIKVTRDVGVNNYEELYKAVILQNEILENTKDELNSNIVSSDRKSELISAKKNYIYSIYVKLRIMYFFLLFIFLIFLIFFQKGWSVYFKFFIFFITAIYPYAINYVEDLIYNIARFLLAIISGAVYTYHNIQ
jgi:hypothetical protein